MTNRTAAHEGFADGIHLDGRLHARIDPQLFERILHGKRIHDRRQHTHIVCAGTFHADGGFGQSAEDIASANDKAKLDALASDIGDFLSHGLDGFHVDAEALVPHQYLARHLEQDAFVFQLCGCGGHGYAPGIKIAATCRRALASYRRLE